MPDQPRPPRQLLNDLRELLDHTERVTADVNLAAHCDPMDPLGRFLDAAGFHLATAEKAISDATDKVAALEGHRVTDRQERRWPPPPWQV